MTLMVPSMTELAKIVGNALSATGQVPRGYREVSEVRMRAALTRSNPNDEAGRAMARLARTLDAGQPLRTDVPRGFYLNIRV